MNMISLGERVKKSQGEGRKRERACIDKHLGPSFHGTRALCIRSLCKLLLVRILTVDRFDLHHFIGWHIARALI